MKLDQLLKLRKPSEDNEETLKIESNSLFEKLLLKLRKVIKLYTEVEFVLFQTCQSASISNLVVLEDINLGKINNWTMILGYQSLFFYLGIKYHNMDKIFIFSGERSFVSSHLENMVKLNLSLSMKLNRCDFDKFYDAFISKIATKSNKIKVSV